MPIITSRTLTAVAAFALATCLVGSALAVPPSNQLLEPNSSRSFQPHRPVVSPYLGITRSNFQRPTANLYVLVRPQIQQRQTNQRQQQQLQRLEQVQQRQIRSSANNGNTRITGSTAGFLNHQKYFSTQAPR